MSCDRGDSFPVVGGVAVLVQGVAVEAQPEPLPTPVIDQIVDAFGVKPTDRRAMEEAFGHKFVFAEDWIQVEADQFVNRVAASHKGLRRALDIADDAAPATIAVNIDPAPRLSTIFWLAKLCPGSLATINLRVENAGNSTLSSEGPQPILLSYHWIDAAGVRHEGNRTELIDDIPPGRTITMAIFVNTPQASGPYKLCLSAMQENVTWFRQTEIEFDVEIGDGPATIDEPAWPRTGKMFDYFYDHQEALRLIGQWRRELFDRPVELIVELGGNANPMLVQIEAAHKVNIDIDPYGMIIGNLMRGADPTLHYVVADGMALPLPLRSIDMLTMFATFHHFPDPVGLLSRLSDFVTDDGLLCLMCEPIGHIHRDGIEAEYLAEIRRGVNEQSFELWEYQQMFDAAKLDVIAAQVDVGSLKIALRPRL